MSFSQYLADWQSRGHVDTGPYLSAVSNPPVRTPVVRISPLAAIASGIGQAASAVPDIVKSFDPLEREKRQYERERLQLAREQEPYERERIKLARESLPIERERLQLVRERQKKMAEAIKSGKAPEGMVFDPYKGSFRVMTQQEITRNATNNSLDRYKDGLRAYLSSLRGDQTSTP